MPERIKNKKQPKKPKKIEEEEDDEDLLTSASESCNTDTESENEHCLQTERDKRNYGEEDATYAADVVWTDNGSCSSGSSGDSDSDSDVVDFDSVCLQPEPSPPPPPPIEKKKEKKKEKPEVATIPPKTELRLWGVIQSSPMIIYKLRISGNHIIDIVSAKLKGSRKKSIVPTKSKLMKRLREINYLRSMREYDLAFSVWNKHGRHSLGPGSTQTLTNSHIKLLKFEDAQYATEGLVWTESEIVAASFYRHGVYDTARQMLDSGITAIVMENPALLAFTQTMLPDLYDVVHRDLTASQVERLLELRDKPRGIPSARVFARAVNIYTACWNAARSTACSMLRVGGGNKDENTEALEYLDKTVTCITRITDGINQYAVLKNARVIEEKLTERLRSLRPEAVNTSLPTNSKYGRVLDVISKGGVVLIRTTGLCPESLLIEIRELFEKLWNHDEVSAIFVSCGGARNRPVFSSPLGSIVRQILRVVVEKQLHSSPALVVSDADRITSTDLLELLLRTPHIRTLVLIGDEGTAFPRGIGGRHGYPFGTLVDKMSDLVVDVVMENNTMRSRVMLPLDIPGEWQSPEKAVLKAIQASTPQQIHQEIIAIKPEIVLFSDMAVRNEVQKLLSINPRHISKGDVIMANNTNRSVGKLKNITCGDFKLTAGHVNLPLKVEFGMHKIGAEVLPVEVTIAMDYEDEDRVEIVEPPASFPCYPAFCSLYGDVAGCYFQRVCAVVTKTTTSRHLATAASIASHSLSLLCTQESLDRARRTPLVNRSYLGNLLSKQ